MRKFFLCSLESTKRSCGPPHRPQGLHSSSVHILTLNLKRDFLFLFQFQQTKWRRVKTNPRGSSLLPVKREMLCLPSGSEAFYLLFCSASSAGMSLMMLSGCADWILLHLYWAEPRLALWGGGLGPESVRMKQVNMIMGSVCKSFHHIRLFSDTSASS